MNRTLIAFIEKTCPGCGTANRIVTNEIQPRWAINCSRCGGTIFERRGVQSCVLRDAPRNAALLREAG